ncbi:MAG: hypothetical protein QUU85_20035, partial [Candidatus Eisenbacteria bacterium]|nr:hypothetical protein [Candidatus Eisenbacteria bacterium]
MRIAIISSWPRDPVRGSGTGRYLIDLEAALRRAGATVLAIGADLDLSDYASFVARRMEWNAALPGDTRACSADILLAIDFDGFALPSGRDGFPPKVVSPQGLFAEIASTEPEPFRSLLLEQARAERRNVADAAFLIVPSAYAAEAVQRHYEAGAERIEIIPH